MAQQTSPDIEIAYLADRTDTILALSRWFQEEWPVYYAGRSLADIAGDFRTEARRSGLPIRLLAFADGELVGTITLREQATHDLPEFSPGLGGLLVPEQQRGRGIGTELVRSGMELAQAQDYPKVYATTINARGILERLGWNLVREVTHGDEELLLFACELEGNQ